MKSSVETEEETNEESKEEEYTIVEITIDSDENNEKEINYEEEDIEKINYEEEIIEKINYEEEDNSDSIILYENICGKDLKFYIDKNSNEKICLEKNENCPLNYPFLNETNNQCLENVFFNGLLNINLTIYNSTEENYILLNLFKTTILESYSGDENLIVTTQDSNIFQLTNTLKELNAKNGLNSNNLSISMIDLADCGKALKKAYNLDENTILIIFKVEKIGEVASNKNIQYEVYNPYTKEKMNLSIYDDEKIDIYIPVTLDDKTKDLQNVLLKYGYDLFDANDSFYQDICTQYTSSNGTDVSISNRRSYYYNDTETSCQERCQYSGYSQETGNLKCHYSGTSNDIETTSISNNNFDEKIIFLSFYDIIKYSNYKVLKCYDLIFNAKKLKYNYGCYFFILYFAFYSAFNIIFYIKGFYRIKIFTANIMYNEEKNK